MFILKDPVEENASPELQIAVKILETNKTYEQGHFVANLLFQVMKKMYSCNSIKCKINIATITLSDSEYRHKC